MAPKKSAAVLQVFIFKDGEFVGNEIFIEHTVVVGRDKAGADLVLDSEHVSRAHAIIEHDGEQVFVKDAGSTNGVFLNDQKIERAEVTRLDEVLVGDYSLKLKLVSKSKEVSFEAGDATRVVPAAAPEAAVPRSAYARSEPSLKPAPAQHVATQSQNEVRVAPAPKYARQAKSRPPPPPEPTAPRIIEEYERTAVQSQPARQAFSFSRAAQWVNSSEHDDDHDDDDEPGSVFALSDKVLATPSERGAADATPHLQVLTLHGESLTGAKLLSPGEVFWIGHPRSFLQKRNDLRRRMRLLRYKKAGGVVVEFPSVAQGVVQRGRERLELKSVAREKKRGVSTTTLERGDELEIVDAPHRYHVRWVHPPVVPEDRRPLAARLRPEKIIERSMLGSLGGHILTILVLTFFTTQSVPPPSETETFAEVTLDQELKLEEPEAPPPEPEPEAPPTPEPEPKPVPRKMEAAPKKVAKTGGTAKAPPGVLGLLSKTGSSAAPGPAAALAAVSNLSAANAPAGSGSFRVSGLVGKLPTSDISIGGGGGGVNTKGGAALLRGGGGGAGVLSGKGSRDVGGQVIKMPRAMRAAGQGSLDRDAIQKVINANIGQIQRCYERELLRTPGLEGKVEVEWVVGTSGSVKSTRQKYASLQSTSAVNCMLSAVKSWKFPQPKGGDVTVTYPFVFKPIGF